jgi:hypothetical protein
LEEKAEYIKTIRGLGYKFEVGMMFRSITTSCYVIIAVVFVVVIGQFAAYSIRFLEVYYKNQNQSS